MSTGEVLLTPCPCTYPEVVGAFEAAAVGSGRPGPEVFLNFYSESCSFGTEGGSLRDKQSRPLQEVSVR